MDAFSRVDRFYIDFTLFKISLYVADVELGVNKWYAQNIYSPCVRATIQVKQEIFSAYEIIEFRLYQ